MRSFRLLALLLPLACTAEGSARRNGDGVPEVVHASASYDQARPLTLEPVLRICGQVDEQACAFRDIEIAVIGPGRAIVLGSASGILQLFDSAGRHVRAVGASGGGPGEYRRPILASFSGDTALHVFDVGTFRLLSYTASGDPLSDRRLRYPTGLSDLRLAGDRFVMLLSRAASDIGDSVTSAFLLHRAGGDASDTLLTVRTAAMFVEGSEFMAPRPLFSAGPVWTLGPRGELVFGDGAQPVVTRYDSLGNAQLRISGLAPVRPVSREDVDRQRSEMLKHPMARGPIREQIERAAANAPRFYPAVGAVRVLDDGDLWIREWTVVGADSARWNVFDPQGAWVGSARLGGRTKVIGGNRHEILVIEHDELDVPAAVWYRVR